MIYVMADLHGEYEKYRRMLETIRFGEEDVLYILGDVVDRGAEPVRILQDMAARENVFPIMGNHDATAKRLIEKLLVEITEENAESHIDAEMMSALMNWQMDGGDSTMKAFRAIEPEERNDLLDYMNDFQLYETVDVGEKTFLLVHGGIENFVPGRPLRAYRPDELICARHDYERTYFDDPSVYIVTGHTLTLALTGKAEIYHSHNNICIDCGATFPGGRLACLCLDTMQEFYID